MTKPYQTIQAQALQLELLARRIENIAGIADTGGYIDPVQGTFIILTPAQLSTIKTQMQTTITQIEAAINQLSTAQSALP